MSNLLEQIRQMNCLACGCSPCDAHHISTRGSLGKAADREDNIIPLCRRCHQEWHFGGPGKFVIKYERVYKFLTDVNHPILLKIKKCGLV